MKICTHIDQRSLRKSSLNPVGSDRMECDHEDIMIGWCFRCWRWVNMPTPKLKGRMFTARLH